MMASSGGVQAHAGKGAGEYENGVDLSSSSLGQTGGSATSRAATDQLLEGSSSLIESESDIDCEMYQAGCSTSFLVMLASVCMADL